MKRTFKTLTAAALIATGSAFALPATDAFAGGQISVTVLPQDQKQKDAMRLGLGVLGAIKGNVTQNGDGNAAGLGQNGGGNTGVIMQDGNGHTGTLTQQGNDAHGLFQFGEGTNGHIAQGGNETGATFQFGWK
ncbi:MAG: curlin repeat-containing protein [Pseudomonadota bacterium]